MNSQLFGSVEFDEKIHNSGESPPPTEDSFLKAMAEKWCREYRHYNALEPYIEGSSIYEDQRLYEAIAAALDGDEDAIANIGVVIFETTKQYLSAHVAHRAAEIEAENEQG